MNGNTINISDFRKGKGSTDQVWLFDLRAFSTSGGFEGTILFANEDYEPGDGGRLRRYADCLDQLPWFLRQQAEKIEPSDNGIPLVMALVFQSSLVRVRLNDDEVTTAEQIAWLDDRFDDAKEAVRLIPGKLDT